MKTSILDEEKKELYSTNSKIDFKRYGIEKVEKILDIDNETLLDNMDCLIGVCYPTENKDDFYISFLNKLCLNTFKLNINDIKGVIVSNIFSDSKEKEIILKKMEEVYTKNKQQKIYFEYYDEINNLLKRRYELTFIKVNKFLHIIGKDKTNHDYLYINNDQLFNTYPEAILIIQNNNIVKCNEKYLDLNNEKSI